jgi:adenylate cyclase
MTPAPAPDGMPAGVAASRSGRHPLWRAVRPALAVAAAALGLVAALYPPLLEPLELKVLDWHAQGRGPTPPPANITIVAIDEPSLRRIGHWPWPRSRTAEIVARLTEGGARVIALDLLLNEPDETTPVATVQALRGQVRELRRELGDAPAARMDQLLEEALVDADTDRLLAEVFAASGRVVLPYSFVFPPATAPPLGDEAQRLLNRSRLIAFQSAEAQHAVLAPRAAGVLAPLPRFQAATAGGGHANVVPDRDGALRRAALVIRLGDGYYPSLTLEAARLGLGVARPRVRLTAQEALDLGGRPVPIDEHGFLHLSYYGPAGTFRALSAAGVLEAASPPAVKDHVVLVGFTALGLMDVRATPFDAVMPGVEIHATAIANMLEGRGLRRVFTFILVEALAALVLGLATPALVPRLGPVWATAVALAVAVTVTGTAHAAFRAGTWLFVLPALSALAVAHVGSVTYQVLVEERERRWIKHAFRQYVPPALVERLASDAGALTFGGERRTLSVLFSDLRGFTTFSESRTPEEVVAILQEYLTAMVEVVFRHRGTLDKFIGDSIMAFFGAPFDAADHAMRACRCAVEMSETLDRLNAGWQAAGRGTLQQGIGIATGEMLVGNFGAAQRFTYTVMGDTVNLGARLESLNKDYQTARHIIISEDTYVQSRDQVVARPLGTVTVKGKLKPVEIYELVDIVVGHRDTRV